MNETTCDECGKPWGLILARGEGPSIEGALVAQVVLTELLLSEYWEPDWDPAVLKAVNVELLPRVRAERIVWISEPIARFCSDLTGDSLEGGHWYDLDGADAVMPAWLLARRKQRWCYRWDCCNIGHPTAYTGPTAQPEPLPAGRRGIGWPPLV